MNSSNEMERSATWGETLLALGPLLLFPVLYLLGIILAPFINDLNDPGLGLGITFSVIGIPLIILVAGWVKKFPRWCFPYWGFALLITLYMYKFTGTIAGYQVRGGVWVWGPLVGVALVGLLWTRSLQPVYVLLKAIRQDWTLLSFTFYGALPLLLIAAYDEVHNKGLMNTLMLIQAVGAFYYMRRQNIWPRFASLVGSYSLSWLVLMIHQSFYWNGRQEIGMTEPGTWQETLKWTSRMGVMLMLILVAPVLISILQWAKKRIRLSDSGN
jgi:hypothetical protein